MTIFRYSALALILAGLTVWPACERHDSDPSSHAAHDFPHGEEARHHDEHAHHHAGDGHHHHHHEAMAADAPLHDHSIFHLTSTWHDQSGEPFRFDSLRGKPAVVVMFFATCTTACPLLINDVRRLEAELPAEILENFQVVFVSLDSQRDTPERLLEFGERRDIDFTRWSLLHGGDAQIRELGAILGVRYRKVGDDIMHSNVVTILDAEGRIIHRTEGLGQPVDQAVLSLTGQG